MLSERLESNNKCACFHKGFLWPIHRLQSKDFCNLALTRDAKSRGAITLFNIAKYKRACNNNSLSALNSLSVYMLQHSVFCSSEMKKNPNVLILPGNASHLNSGTYTTNPTPNSAGILRAHTVPMVFTKHRKTQ